MKNKNIWVIKIGSSLVTKKSPGINIANIKKWASQISKLMAEDIGVILVSSGAIAEGMKRLGVSDRPTKITDLQAMASIGQMGLVQAYETEFKKYRLLTAQVLLTHQDLNNKERYSNAKSTIRNLIKMGIIPVINENDVVSTEEIKFGDNDTLAALVSNLVNANKLIILTDQNGLYDNDPRKVKNANLINEISIKNRLINKYAKPSISKLGRGGMITKVSAAKIAAKSKTETVIAKGTKENILIKIKDKDKTVGTYISSS